MSDDLASNNNTIGFNFNTEMLSELSPGPVPEPIIESLNGFNPFIISFNPNVPPPNLALLQKYRGQSVADDQYEMPNSMNTIIFDSKVLRPIEINSAARTLERYDEK